MFIFIHKFSLLIVKKLKTVLTSIIVNSKIRL